jgi:hypothetical protein
MSQNVSLFEPRKLAHSPDRPVPHARCPMSPVPSPEGTFGAHRGSCQSAKKLRQTAPNCAKLRQTAPNCAIYHKIAARVAGGGVDRWDQCRQRFDRPPGVGAVGPAASGRRIDCCASHQTRQDWPKAKMTSCGRLNIFRARGSLPRPPTPRRSLAGWLHCRFGRDARTTAAIARTR